MTLFDAAALDLDEYLTRIGYGGATRPTLETLHAIALHHPAAIPFENLNPLLGRPVPLDLASLQQKLVRDGRGGWCFEHNLLLGAALSALGYSVNGLAARVLWNAVPGTVTPRSHMVLLIELDEEQYIVDAGFGGLTLTAPLRLDADVVQPTPHESFRLTRAGDGFTVEASLKDDWKPLYRFDLQRQAFADYQVTNWYLSHHPQSHFVTSLIAARTPIDRRLALRNAELAIHRGGCTERRALTGAPDLRAALEELFDIRVPAGDDVDAALTRIVTATPLATT
jgi:N-hydroxyarylamine O-acetyltransferase